LVADVSTRVYLEWDELVLDKGARLSFEERRRRWGDLYARTFVDGRWVVDADDAAWVASLGFWLGWEAADYRLGRAVLRQLFAHPDLSRGLYVVDEGQLRIDEAIADILCGNVEPAINRLRALLTNPNGRRGSYRSVGWGLQLLIDAFDPSDPADPLVRSLVAEVIGSYRGLKRVSKGVEGAETNADLRAALNHIHGR
jgi:hypothetical protein